MHRATPRPFSISSFPCCVSTYRLATDQLVEELLRWPVLAPDALEQAQAQGFDFEVWRSGLALERKGKFAGEDFAKNYGAILMPGPMIEVMMVASRYHVPAGLAYIRMWEVQS